MSATYCVSSAPCLQAREVISIDTLPKLVKQQQVCAVLAKTTCSGCDQSQKFCMPNYDVAPRNKSQPELCATEMRWLGAFQSACITNKYNSLFVMG